ncbi:MAG: hypothetical protein R3311_00150 [Oceanisphaera sp.]|nr:hypothetical protein [Oceanisphaera sp.]
MANLLKHGWQQEEKNGDDALPGKMEKHAHADDSNPIETMIIF